MNDEVIKKAKELIKKEETLKDTLNLAGKLELHKTVKEEKYPDSIEIDLGGPGNRGKFYFNADTPEISEMRLENYFKVIAQRDKLTEARKVIE